MTRKRSEGVSSVLSAIPSEHLPSDETGKHIIEVITGQPHPTTELQLALQNLTNSVDELKSEVSSRLPPRVREFKREVRRARITFNLLKDGVDDNFPGHGSGGHGGDPH